MPSPQRIGFYGKLPSHGDFLRRRVSDDFVEHWDRWLQDVLAASKNALGNDWLDIYLTSPVWRFACAASACGPTSVIGLMAPSVDRVGRYFPLTIVAELQDESASSAVGADAFFDAAEQLMIETLEADPVDFTQFDERVAGLAGFLSSHRAAASALVLDESAAAILSGAAKSAWTRVPLDSPPRPGRTLEHLAWRRLEEIHQPLVVWWTEGSGVVDTSWLISTGLPDAARFVALLDGQWARHGWTALSARATRSDTQVNGGVQTQSLQYRSSALSDVGRVRNNNEDSFLDRPDIGLWTVADGLGGHKDGEVASRMVCDVLAGLVPEPTFDGTVSEVCRRISEVNHHLLKLSARAASERVATTVVTLLARGRECAVVWAGDSRAYRWRDGTLEKLTTDHSVVAARPEGQAASSVITRALGAAPNLKLDLVRYEARPGDRFLLCSDGLTNAVPETAIATALSETALDRAVRGLVDSALAAGGPDNVTVLVVEAAA